MTEQFFSHEFTCPHCDLKQVGRVGSVYGPVLGQVCDHCGKSIDTGEMEQKDRERFDKAVLLATSAANR